MVWVEVAVVAPVVATACACCLPPPVLVRSERERFARDHLAPRRLVVLGLCPVIAFGVVLLGAAVVRRPLPASVEPAGSPT